MLNTLLGRLRRKNCVLINRAVIAIVKNVDTLLVLLDRMLLRSRSARIACGGLAFLLHQETCLLFNYTL